MSQDPNPNRNAQEQNSQVDRVEPHFDNLFHLISPFHKRLAGLPVNIPISLVKPAGR
jgi:hypothetical protein